MKNNSEKIALINKLRAGLHNFLDCLIDIYAMQDSDEKPKNKPISLELTSSEDEYLSVKQLSQKFPIFSESSIRRFIFDPHKAYCIGESNGFNQKCVKRIGRKVVINVREFKEWVEQHKEGEIKQTILAKK